MRPTPARSTAAGSGSSWLQYAMMRLRFSNCSRQAARNPCRAVTRCCRPPSMLMRRTSWRCYWHTGPVPVHPTTGHCPLWEAVVRHDGQILQALLADGVSPASHCEDEDAPLIAAARAGQLDSVQTLLTAGADVDTPDRQGETPLMIAAAASDVELLQALLGRHARIDFEDRQGRNALWQAAWSGTLPTVDALLRAGADPNQADGSGLTPLHA